MDQRTLLLLLIVACAVGIVALLLHLRRERLDRDEAARESPIAMSSEGVKLCPHCATENLWTDTQCVRCRRPLPDAPPRAW